MPAKQKIDEKILTLRNAATFLNCSKAQVRKWVSAGTLPAFHRGGVLVVKREDVEKFVNELEPVETKQE